MERQHTGRLQKRRYGLIIFLTVFLLFIGIGIFGSLYFNTTQIVVSGNEYYTESELKKSITSNGYIGNTLLMSIKNRIKPQTYFPFIDKVTMSFHESHVLEVKITEKVRAGTVKQGEDYYYFNLAGKVLEKKNVLFDEIPVLEDSEMGKPEVGKNLPTTESHLKEIVQTVRGIANNKVEISKIKIRKSGDLILTQGKYEILIGSPDYIDAKIAKLPELLEVVKDEYQKGTINMKLYTDMNEIITFQE